MGQSREIWHLSERLVYSGFSLSCTSSPGHVGEPGGIWLSDLKNRDVQGAGNAACRWGVFPLSVGLKMFCPCLGFATKTKSIKFKSKVQRCGFQIRGDFIKVKFTAGGTKPGGECASG